MLTKDIMMAAIIGTAALIRLTSRHAILLDREKINKALNSYVKLVVLDKIVRIFGSATSPIRLYMGDSIIPKFNVDMG